MNEIIRVSNLTKIFNHKIAVNKISFSVKTGSIFGFLGTNGAGKTTTIKMLTGLLLPTDGESMVCGFNPATQEKKISSKIGIIPDHVSLYEDMSIENNLRFFSKLYHVGEKRISEVMEEFELNSHAKIAIKKLSKGFKQRVLIARSLLHNPDLLFMDEPTSGLDPNYAFEIRQLIRKLKEARKTIFITTHNMNEAQELCDEISIIDKGTIILKENIETVKAMNSTRKITVKTMDFEKEYTFDQINEISKIPHDSIISIHTSEQSLEDVFLNLTKG